MTKGRQFGPEGWTADRLPDLSGRNYLITGGNSGIGFHAARLLGERGAHVTLFCRSRDKANAALKDLAAAAPRGAYDFIRLELSDLSSVRVAAKQARERYGKIDALINNAGIMMTPKRELTVDGFEMQFGVNHLGHFALAGLLSDLVEEAGGRFVAVSSLMHRYAPRLRLNDLQFERNYSPVAAYSHSKLANLAYALELDRRLQAAGAKAKSFACHPGYSATNLQSAGPSRLMAALLRPATAILSQPAAKGAVPTALCAAGLEAERGGFYGPTGFQDMRGPIDRAEIAAPARDLEAAAKLWEESEKLTGVNWPIFRKI